jgi:hypothetical protein
MPSASTRDKLSLTREIDSHLLCPKRSGARWPACEGLELTCGRVRIASESIGHGMTAIARRAHPGRFRCHGGRKRIVAPGGCEIALANKPQPTARWSRGWREHGAGSGCSMPASTPRSPRSRVPVVVARARLGWRTRSTRTSCSPPGSTPSNSASHDQLLRLSPARAPGPFFPGLPPGPWWPLFRPDLTSLSTGKSTGDCRTPDRKSDDDASAKCGARECRQDQHHDPPSQLGSDNP